MSRPLIYLAGHITGLSADEAARWRRWAAARLNGAGLPCYSPIEAAANTARIRPPDDPFARESFNLRRCDIVLANLLAGEAKSIQSVGTLVTIGMAWGLGKTVVLVARNSSPFLQAAATAIFADLDKAIDWIIGIQPEG